MSYRIILSENEEADLKRVIRENQKRKNILKRAYCILLKNEGQKNENITRLLGIHEDTIADWSKIYMKKGLEGLLQFKYSDRRSSKLKPFKHKIKRFASAKKMKTIEQLQKKVQEKFGVEIEYSWFYRYCVKNGIYAALKNKEYDKT
ncbi:MAG TPA: helix-turn-helix domain-containing protein [Bacteroidales bacterium]|nr:helix-turn-helix domain-containing protein [Bacteroidales bacterium]